MKSVRSSPDAELYLNQAEDLEVKDPAKAIDLVQEALNEAIKTKNTKVEAESYFLLGNINQNSGQFDLSITYYKKAKVIFEKDYETEGLYNVTKSLAESYDKNLNYDLALKEYASFLKLAKKKGNVLDEVEAYLARAAIYKKQKDLDESLAELNKAELLSEQNSFAKPKLSEVKLQKGEVYEAQSNDEGAYQQYKQSEEISISNKDKRGLLNSNQRISGLLNKQGKKKEAVEKQKEGLSLFKSRKEERMDENDYNFYEPDQEVGISESKFNFSGTADAEETKELKLDEIEEEPLEDADETRVNLDIAKTYIELDNSVEAIGYLNTAIDISSTSGDIAEEKEAFGLLSEAYFKVGDYDNALTAYRSYVDLVDSIYKLRESDILASLDLNSELSKRLQRITSLEKDRNLQEKTIELLESQRVAEEERNKQLKVLVYSLIIGLLLMLFLIYFMNKNSKQKRLTNQLLALKNLRTQMNPHFIFNALNSVNNFISQSDERSANRYLSEFSRLMRLVLENSEHDFIPLAKEIEILKLYVGLEHSRFSEKFEYDITIDSSIDLDNYEIPPMIVQPYIENAVWHGLRYLEDKGQLNLMMSERNGELVIVIEDNGIGRKKSLEMKTENQKTAKSTAMKNIAERLSIMNRIHESDLLVKIDDLNKDGSGTRVELTIPAKK